MNVENELKLVGLTPEDYENFLQDCGDKINGITDLDWSEIIEKYNLPFDRRRISESMGRNILGGNFVREFYKNKVIGKTSNEVAKELIAKEQDIYKAKRKLQDERNELNKMLREEARYEENLRLFEERLENIGKKKYPIELDSSFSYKNSMVDNNTLICCLSDLHIGIEYDSSTGKYDIETAIYRLGRYIEEIKKIAKRHCVNKCVVVLLGDCISGSLHLTLQISNRENIVDQTMTACEIIADFIHKLKEIIPTIEIYSVPGNHSRVEKNKDDALLGEKLDNIIPWFLSHIFKHDEGIYVGLKEADDTYSYFNVDGKDYAILHGDFDGISDTEIQRFCAYIGKFPYAIIMGHKHHPAMNEVSGIKVIQCGSLMGSGDDYTRRKRLTGRPSQTVLICNDMGIEAIYPIELN